MIGLNGLDYSCSSWLETGIPIDSAGAQGSPGPSTKAFHLFEDPTEWVRRANSQTSGEYPYVWADMCVQRPPRRAFAIGIEYFRRCRAERESSGISICCCCCSSYCCQESWHATWLGTWQQPTNKATAAAATAADVTAHTVLNSQAKTNGTESYRQKICLKFWKQLASN